MGWFSGFYDESLAKMSEHEREFPIGLRFKYLGHDMMIARHGDIRSGLLIATVWVHYFDANGVFHELGFAPDDISGLRAGIDK